MTPWTEIASDIVLGLGANTENLAVGLAYGLRRRRIGLARNLLIAAVTTAAALLPLIAGRDLRALALTSAPDHSGFPNCASHAAVCALLTIARTSTVEPATS